MILKENANLLVPALFRAYGVAVAVDGSLCLRLLWTLTWSWFQMTTSVLMAQLCAAHTPTAWTLKAPTNARANLAILETERLAQVRIRCRHCILFMRTL